MPRKMADHLNNSSYKVAPANSNLLTEKLFQSGLVKGNHQHQKEPHDAGAIKLHSVRQKSILSKKDENP